eukprot:TRINITY_DN2922_c7_g1_i1.p1 TRINITY_DN2922_c7_g1~~TRINITY_DN2922_c7_g1_i1.p1  ORF type:complete len:195 (-),score=39.34 TRINITY_DN2922_c7_g1_i1:254-838(-)
MRLYSALLLLCLSASVKCIDVAKDAKEPLNSLRGTKADLAATENDVDEDEEPSLKESEADLDQGDDHLDLVKNNDLAKDKETKEGAKTKVMTKEEVERSYVQDMEKKVATMKPKRLYIHSRMELAKSIVLYKRLRRQLRRRNRRCSRSKWVCKSRKQQSRRKLRKLKNDVAHWRAKVFIDSAAGKRHAQTVRLR